MTAEVRGTDRPRATAGRDSATWRDLSAHHWWWRARDQFIQARLSAWLPAQETGRVLAVGCGDRLAFDWLSRWGVVYGIESDRALLSFESRQDTRVFVGSALDTLPFDGPFDLVTAFDVLERIEHDLTTMRRLASLLSRDGLIVLHLPAWRHLWTAHDDVNQHWRRYSFDDVVHLCAASSLEILEMRSWFYLAALAKAILHVVPVLGGTGTSRLPSAQVNRMLLTVCRWEFALLGRWTRLPGSSIFVVARRRSKKAPAGR